MNDFWLTYQIPPEVIDLANKDFDQVPTYDAQVVRGQKDVTNYAHRDSTLRVPEFGHWFAGILYRFGIVTNNNLWQFKIDGQENLQVADYSENQHFDWHMDVIPFSGPTDRKVSVICLLTDPDEYYGGHFQVQNPHDDKDVRKIELQKGTMVAFPSVIRHKVTPVAQGTRRSATMWLTGPCYR